MTFHVMKESKEGAQGEHLDKGNLKTLRQDIGGIVCEQELCTERGMKEKQIPEEFLTTEGMK